MCRTIWTNCVLVRYSGVGLVPPEKLVHVLAMSIRAVIALASVVNCCKASLDLLY